MSISEEKLNDLEVKKTSFGVDKKDASIPKPLPRTYNHFLLITAKPRQGKMPAKLLLGIIKKGGNGGKKKGKKKAKKGKKK